VRPPRSLCSYTLAWMEALVSPASPPAPPTLSDHLQCVGAVPVGYSALASSSATAGDDVQDPPSNEYFQPSVDSTQEQLSPPPFDLFVTDAVASFCYTGTNDQTCASHLLVKILSRETSMQDTCAEAEMSGTTAAPNDQYAVWHGAAGAPCSSLADADLLAPLPSPWHILQGSAQRYYAQVVRELL